MTNQGERKDGEEPNRRMELAAMASSPGTFMCERLFKNGDIYVGSWQGNLPEGTGKYLWSDGCMYAGEWSKGKKSGKGKISWPSGATYEGDFMAGYIHGIGTFTSVDGNTYKGSWYMNDKKGLGTKSYGNGDVYEGSWNHGLAEGVGRYVWKNGNEYVGDWKSGVMSGRGVLNWACGDKYDGQWLDGLQHGYGVFTWCDGGRYVGSWSRGLKDGKGIYIPPRKDADSDGSEEEGAGDEDYKADGDERKGERGGGGGAREGGKKSRFMIRIEKPCISSSASNNECSIASENGPETCLSFDRCRSFGDSDARSLCPGSVNASETGKDGDDDEDDEDDEDDNGGNDDSANGDGDDTTDDHDADDCPAIRASANRKVSRTSVVEREYAQGVLINEIVKGSARRHMKNQHCMEEQKKTGETIFKGHHSYHLMLNLQLGIRYTVGKITPEPRRELSPSDFGPKARIWMNFPREGSQLTPPHQATDFKWKDYCPVVFRHLRELFRIDTADYMLSVCGNNGLRELSSPGKSGSAFYLSHDDRFMIKTMRKTEVKVLLGMLPNYYHHVKTYENTLITKFFGLHRIRPAGGHKVRFVVMGNMFCTELQIHRRFDLKGSSQGRAADKVQMDESTTLKDLDLDFVFRLEPSWRKVLLRQIECDCKFLKSERIMDYSFLLGVHFRAPQFPTMFSGGNPFPKEGSENLVLVAHEPNKNMIPSAAGSHVRGSPLKASEAGNEEIDLLLPGTARLRILLGVNMPARADRKPSGKSQEYSGESYDVVLYFGIIDILQEYDMTKRLENAYKSLQYDSLSISAIEPSLYARRFQDFLRKTFPESRD